MNIRARSIMNSRDFLLQKHERDVKYHRVYVDSQSLPHTEDTVKVVKVLTKCLEARDCWQELLHPEANKGDRLMPVVPSLEEFNNDLRTIWYSVLNGSVMSYCWKRLEVLQQKYKFHSILNSELEKLSSNRSNHRDFYDVASVDNHIHLTGAFTCKFVADFVNRKIVHDGKKEVKKTKQGDMQTLGDIVEDVWSSKGMVRGSRFTIDDVGSLSETNMFRRFDVFNNAYNLCGSNSMREIFLKPSGVHEGKYLAEMTKTMFEKIKNNRFNNYTEPRISIYGKNKQEWGNLAQWMFDNDVANWSGWKSDSKCCWLIQIPRIYRFLKSGGAVDTFQECIRNIFDPIIEATENPGKHPRVARLLKLIVGFDSVDDESLPEEFTSDIDPSMWNKSDSPPYSYQLYHVFKELVRVNHLRRRRRLNTFSFRPHTGEAGPTHHLGTGFLLATSINHGVRLRKVAAMEYLYYLAQIGVAMSPFSNNALFKRLSDNPFPTYFRRGLNVSLTTDDPLQFHISNCPLLEEYTTARQLWMLSMTDLCEISRNSVAISGLSDRQKRSLIGDNYIKLPEFEGHDVSLTNVSEVRAAYRWETLLSEYLMLKSIISSCKLEPKNWKSLVMKSQREVLHSHKDIRRVTQYVDIAIDSKETNEELGFSTESDIDEEENNQIPIIFQDHPVVFRDSGGNPGTIGQKAATFKDTKNQKADDMRDERKVSFDLDDDIKRS